MFTVPFKSGLPCLRVATVWRSPTTSTPGAPSACLPATAPFCLSITLWRTKKWWIKEVAWEGQRKKELQNYRIVNCDFTTHSPKNWSTQKKQFDNLCIIFSNYSTKNVQNDIILLSFTVSTKFTIFSLFGDENILIFKPKTRRLCTRFAIIHR